MNNIKMPEILEDETVEVTIHYNKVTPIQHDTV